MLGHRIGKPWNFKQSEVDDLVKSGKMGKKRRRTMDANMIDAMRWTVENNRIEFKQYGNGVYQDTFETVYAFLNRLAGDIFLSIENEDTVAGIPEKSVNSPIKKFIKIANNSNPLFLSSYFMPELFFPGKKLEKTREHFLSNFGKKFMMSIAEVARQLGIVPRVRECHVKKLKDAGILEYIGFSRGGHWRPLERNRGD